MKNDNLPGLSSLWLISLALVLGTTIVVLIPASIASGDPIKASDWIGFAGSVTAGSMTLIAATFAWFAVQRQITAQEKAEQRAAEAAALRQTTQEAEAKFAAVLVITQTVHAATAVAVVTNCLMNALTTPAKGRMDEAIRPAQVAEWRARRSKAMTQLKATMGHWSISQAWQELAIDDKANYLMLTATVHTMVNLFDNPPPGDEIAILRTFQQAQDRLSKILKGFDESLAEGFDRDSIPRP